MDVQILWPPSGDPGQARGRISRPAVSQHLKVLKGAGLIRLAGEHRLSPYELVPGPVLRAAV